MTIVRHNEIMSIGELASRFGVSPETLRVWERQGRIPCAFRTAGGHRRYGIVHVRSIALLMGYRVVSKMSNELAVSEQENRP